VTVNRIGECLGTDCNSLGDKYQNLLQCKTNIIIIIIIIGSTALGGTWPPRKSNKCYIFCVCVSVALVIQHAMRMRRITVSSCLSVSIVFFHIIS